MLYCCHLRLRKCVLFGYLLIVFDRPVTPRQALLCLLQIMNKEHIHDAHMKDGKKSIATYLAFLYTRETMLLHQNSPFNMRYTC